jgi:cysteine desulfurase
MNRRYLDYNSTSPLSPSFIEALANGSIPFENASSQHSSGKKASQYIRSVDEIIFKHFKLPLSEFNVLYHSGATEAVNQFLNITEKDILVYFSSDHPCVLSMAKNLKAKGLSTLELKFNDGGEFNVGSVISQIKSQNIENKNVHFHFTYMHNETGIVWSLADAERLKLETGAVVYVDAVQTPGKILNYNELNPVLDIYTFSGHKFGALKGIGFSLYKKSFIVTPLIHGGGQQNELRSGTMNIHGIASIDFALRDLTKTFQTSAASLLQLKNDLSTLIDEKENLKIIKNESINTICFIHKTLKADIMMVHFDMAGLDISSGSACSSGSIDASQTLLDMGFENQSKNGIRISLGWQNLTEIDDIVLRFKKVLLKL